MIGIYGGTFDPVHYGHLRTAVEVKELFDLQELRLLPSFQPPHRLRPGALPEMRLQMLQLAIKNQSGLQVDTREFEREGPSYMVDTLQSLRAEGNNKLFLFVGADAFSGLTGWRRWQSLFDYAHLVVMNRPESQSVILPEFLKQRLVNSRDELKQYAFGKLYFQNVTQLDISASKIRGIFAEKRNPAYLLPNEVINYIQQNKLYQDIECK
jgi:nicotinate-nucleotide adenylyltransferase